MCLIHPVWRWLALILLVQTTAVLPTCKTITAVVVHCNTAVLVRTAAAATQHYDYDRFSARVKLSGLFTSLTVASSCRDARLPTIG